MEKTNKNTSNKFLLAVSGGVDSMVMLHMFLQAMPTEKIGVVSVNHNLRPEGAFDCNFVKQYCQEQGVTFFYKSIMVQQYATDAKLSIETAGRQLRYKAIEEVADTYGFDTICLAHHADDNAETVLLHLVRGGGLRGVAGIRRRQGRYFRPLLKYSKKDILNYAEQNQLPYVEDKTNSDTRYKRNLVRHEIIPALQEINPNALFAINAFANIAREEDEFLDGLADISFVHFEENSATIPLQPFKRLHPVLQARVLRKIMRKLGYFKDVEQRHVSDLLKLTRSTNGENKIDLPFGLVARRSYDLLTICPMEEKIPQIEQVLPFMTGEFTLGEVKVGIYDYPPALPHLKIDADKLPLGAVLRNRKQGDRFAKFGSGEKKLKDYLIDAKVPQHQRDALVVIADENTVYAVFGLEISEKVKITQDTEKILYLAVLN